MSLTRKRLGGTLNRNLGIACNLHDVKSVKSIRLTVHPWRPLLVSANGNTTTAWTYRGSPRIEEEERQRTETNNLRHHIPYHSMRGFILLSYPFRSPRKLRQTPHLVRLVCASSYPVSTVWLLAPPCDRNPVPAWILESQEPMHHTSLQPCPSSTTPI